MNKSRICGALLLSITLLLAGCTVDDAAQPPQADESPSLQIYGFDGEDSSESTSTNASDELFYVMMNQGSDINWTSVGVTIQVDGSTPINCQQNDPSADCTYDVDNDNEWSVGEEIIISEGATDLCSNSCSIDVTIKHTEDQKIIGNINDILVE